MEFEQLYFQILTEPRWKTAQKELAAHCSDLMDAYEDQRCRYKSPRGDGIPVTLEERADCRRYAEEVKDEMFWFASLLGPSERKEWNQMVIEETRRKNSRRH